MARKSRLANPQLSEEFLSGLFKPEFIPQELDLTNFVQEVEVEEEARQSLQAKTPNASPSVVLPGGRNDVPIPLTEAEAAEADRQIAATLERIRQAKEQINSIRSKLDEQVQPANAGAGGGEYRFSMDISNKRRIRRAIKQLFGIKTDTITYSMYKEMLAAKASIEIEQGDSYTSGFPKKKDKKKNSSDRKKKDKSEDKKGFLERHSKKDDSEDGASQEEEQYLRMFPKIGRDFVYKGDLDKQITQILNILDPFGKNPVARDDAEAHRRAKEYKAILDSGKDSTKIYKDLIKLDDD